MNRYAQLALATAVILIAPAGYAQAIADTASSQPTDGGTPISSAQAAAQIAAAVPGGCTTPLGDTLTGTAGAAPLCMSRPDSTRPTAVQASNTTLNADCTWSVTFSRAFTSSSPIVHAEAVLSPSATQPVPCSPTARSTTTQSGRCFQSQQTTLAAVTVVGISVATGAQVVNPTASTCSAGTPIMVWGRDPTQGG